MDFSTGFRYEGFSLRLPKGVAKHLAFVGFLVDLSEKHLTFFFWQGGLLDLFGIRRLFCFAQLLSTDYSAMFSSIVFVYI